MRDLSVFLKIAYSFLKENSRNTLNYWETYTRYLNMLFYNTASVLGVASLLLALFLFEQDQCRMFRNLSVVSKFYWEEGAACAWFKTNQEFFQAKCSLSDERFNSLLLTFSLYDYFFLEDIYIIKVWTRTWKIS